MGLLDTAKKAIGVGKAKKVEPSKSKTKKSAKEIATEKGEPWVTVIDIELDPENPGNGAFELDWNEPFIKQLWKAGYRDEEENDMVDRWFQDVCRHVVLESYEKDEAMVTRNDLGDGKTEYR
tara:strand:- start:286 stop:651 length:366 start_codon:yes stop_codon:yes gene_type:complete